MSKLAISCLLLFMLFALISLACVLLPPQPIETTGGNLRIINAITPLDNLMAERVMVIVDQHTPIGDVGPRGIYWLDLDSHTLYLAARPEAIATHNNRPYFWAPDGEMITWTGEALVYGTQTQGFFRLAPDGEATHLTDVGQRGELAKNGREIVRATRCGADEMGIAHEIVPLDRLVASPPAHCFYPTAFRSDDELHLHVSRVWNPWLAQADFVISERSGRGNTFRIHSRELVRLQPDGEIRVIKELPVEADDLKVHPRPDGRAFYLNYLHTAVIIDDQGDALVDLISLGQRRFPGKRLINLTWLPDSGRALMVWDECLNGRSCSQIFVLADANFETVTELATIANEHRWPEIVIAPDSSYAAAVYPTHQGADFPPRVITISLPDGAMEEYIFRHSSILRGSQWVH